MSPSRLLPVLALTGLLAGGLPATARADDTTPAQAADLQAQLRSWFASLAGPAADVGPHPVQVSPEADHFLLSITVPDALAKLGMLPPGLTETMKATPLDAGRWALDDLVIPNPLVVRLPPAPVPAKAANDQPKTPAAKPVPQTFTLKFDSQQFHGVFDPAFTTTSSFDSKMVGLHVTTPTSETTTANISSHVSFEPVADGRIDVIGVGDTKQSITTMQIPNSAPVRYTIDSSHSSGRIRGMSPANLAALIRSLTTLVPTLPDSKDSLNPGQRTLARAAVFALRDLFNDGEAKQTLHALKINAAGQNASVDTIVMGMRAGVDDGKLQLQTSVSLEGFDSPQIPAGVFRDYLPQKISLKPRISGVPSDDLIKLMLRAIDSDTSDRADLQEAGIALLGEGPLEVGIDDLEIDLGRAGITGHGSVDIAGPTDITGEAEIAMMGLDALIKRANTTPQIKPIVPALLFLKGIGKANGETTVWNITYQDNKVMVNDTDMTAMLPGQNQK
jgi:hypothetical protein